MAASVFCAVVEPTDGVLHHEREASPGLPENHRPEQLRRHGGPSARAEQGLRLQALHKPPRQQDQGLLL